MEEVERAGLSLRAEIYAVLGTLFVSVLSFGVIVAHDASAPGELEAVVTQLRPAPAASAVVPVEGKRKAKPG